MSDYTDYTDYTDSSEPAPAKPVAKNHVDLVEPITVDGQQLKRLTFRRPRGRDLRRMDSMKGEHGKLMGMIPILSEDGLTPEIVNEMDGADVISCEILIGDFLGAGAGMLPPS